MTVTVLNGKITVMNYHDKTEIDLNDMNRHE